MALDRLLNVFAHQFCSIHQLVQFLSVLVIPTLSWPALCHFWENNKIVIDLFYY